MRNWMASIALAAPVTVAALGLAAVSAAERAGHPLFAADAARNSAEAAVDGNAAAVVRFLDAGEDPLALHSVKPSAISSEIPLVTTAEAAILGRRPEMLLVLEQRGALRDPALRASLACLAADRGESGAISFLSPSGAPACEPGAALERIMARGRASR